MDLLLQMAIYSGIESSVLFPNKNTMFSTCYDIKFVCSFISGGEWTRKHSLLSYPLNTKHKYMNIVNLQNITVEYSTILKTAWKEESETLPGLWKDTPHHNLFGWVMGLWILWWNYALRNQKGTVIWLESRKPWWHWPNFRHGNQGSYTVTDSLRS